QLQHGITEEFEALIVLHCHPLLVRDRGVSQRQEQMVSITKGIPQAGLNSVERGHGKIQQTAGCPLGFVEGPVSVASDGCGPLLSAADRKSTRLNSSHVAISYAVFCLKKKNIAGSDEDRSVLGNRL